MVGGRVFLDGDGSSLTPPDPDFSWLHLSKGNSRFTCALTAELLLFPDSFLKPQWDTHGETACRPHISRSGLGSKYKEEHLR